MADPVVADFRSLFPQFAATDEAAVTAWFTQAALRFKAIVFGSQWPMAVYLYTAHQLLSFDPAIASSGGDADVHGPVTAESVGDVSRSYGDTIDASKVSTAQQEFLTTVYGRKLVSLMATLSAGHARVVQSCGW